MKLHSDSFPDNGVIPAEFAFAQIDQKVRVRFADNKNPHLAWSEVPEGTQSFVILCVDDCAPTDPTDVNQVDREVPAVALCTSPFRASARRPSRRSGRAVPRRRRVTWTRC